MYTFSVPHEHKFTLEMCLLNLQVWCRYVPLSMYDRVKISYNSPLSKISTDATEITQAGFTFLQCGNYSMYAMIRYLTCIWIL